MDGMNGQTTSVFIADSDRRIVKWLEEQVGSQPDMVVAGVGSTGQDVLRRVGEINPDVVVVDMALPDMDGIHAAWLIGARSPKSVVIITSSEANIEYAQRAMRAGAQGFLIKPLAAEEVLGTIRDAHQRFTQQHKLLVGNGNSHQPKPNGSEERYGKRLAIFGAKGGVGKTTMAVNLAVALRQVTNKSVLLVDADFFFGDACVQLDLQPTATIADIAERVAVADLDSQVLSMAMIAHTSGVRVLAGPQRPEQADRITSEFLQRVLNLLPNLFDYIVIDCQTSYDERMLSVLESSDVVLLVLTPEIGPLRNARHFLQLLGTLSYPLDKVFIVLNRANGNLDIGPADVETALGRTIQFKVESAGRRLMTAANLGEPFVVRDAGSSVARAVFSIAGFLAEEVN